MSLTICYGPVESVLKKDIYLQVSRSKNLVSMAISARLNELGFGSFSELTKNYLKK